ncbi:MAG TPA: MurR/RpiR family transcriptional regulator [Candidatus Erysipelatoclostridium merdavium]|uniref:MurR/RpiR family transcriptional regulator n=1 Tax=Candidatus Erysipelatoclostridium merdavium TaxID=2838566 RepID=A0A9D2BLH8_9FIRM|nr:MurR/RpiR family transcriptional regulator [Candidatus Erysipelatoclostridium merdavium]
MNIQHLIEKYELNNLEKQIVSYMQKNISQLKSIGIRQMAKDNYTSTSTIYKLCNKFGFKGYSDMIYHLTSAKDTTINFNEKYLDYKKEFSSLMSDKSKRIIVFGLGFSAPIAEYIQQRLTLMGYQALCVVHMEMFSQVFFENTLLIVISYSGKTRRLSEIVTTASKNNIPIISFIASKESPIYQDSTLPIIIGKYDSFLHDNSKPNFFFGETIIAFETLLFD